MLTNEMLIRMYHNDDSPPPYFSHIHLYPPSCNLCRRVDPLYQKRMSIPVNIGIQQFHLPKTMVACSCHPVEVTLMDRSRLTRYGPFPIKRPSILEHPGPPLSQIICIALNMSTQMPRNMSMTISLPACQFQCQVELTKRKGCHGIWE